MIFELADVALICLGYMLVLFGIAFITERGWIPDSWVRHPITYILSLGVCASAWEFYGLVDLANQFGYGALAYYLGIGAIFLFAPIALTPLAEIARRYQIRSLADLFVFRYHSHGVGTVVTAGMAIAVVPLLALQLQAVADTLSLLTTEVSIPEPLEDAGFTSREALALVYCVILALFTILFGSKRERHRGLITALAFESLLKLFALGAVGIFALNLFGGLDGLDTWLAENPQHNEKLYTPIRGVASHTLLLIFIATAVSMPHIFHMSVVENPVRNALATVTWGFPLFLLLMALPIFPILWAGIKLEVPFHPQYFTLGVPLIAESRGLTVLAFVGGLSAATGALVAIVLALSTMVLNHWLLPMLRLDARWNIYNRVLWLRRMLIFAIFLFGFVFFQFMHNRTDLTEIALLAFIASMQFLPGVIAIAYWPRGTSLGFITGLSVGFGIWFIGLFLPTVFGVAELNIPGSENPLSVGMDIWHLVAIWSLALNAATFVIGSYLTKVSYEEQYSAELCAVDEISHPRRNTLDVTTAGAFKKRLEGKLGRDIANQEVDRALAELGLNRSERRPFSLRRLRDRLEANLSGLVGVSVAAEILDQHIPYKIPSGSGSADITLIEQRFNDSSQALSGIAAELNHLRLYYRKTLAELPMAICSLGPDDEILMWNSAMAELTNIPSDEVTGSHLRNLDEPWRRLIKDFIGDKNTHTHRHAMVIEGRSCWFSLHKAIIEAPVPDGADGQLILIEDVTEVQQLEQELLHSERLASVGRLAAGVAHEIGNPVTGIACLAQNILEDSQDPDTIEAVEQILAQTQRISRIVQSLVSFSHAGRQDPESFSPVNLHLCAQEAIQLLSLQKENTPVEYRNEIPSELTIAGDSQRMIQVFVNLLSNARDASPPGGLILISGERNQHWVNCAVTDQGEGIAKGEIGRILEPFYTTKEPGSGTGLGLSMVYSIVTDHQGQIDIQSPIDEQLRRGARFTLQFPQLR